MEGTAKGCDVDYNSGGARRGVGEEEVQCLLLGKDDGVDFVDGGRLMVSMRMMLLLLIVLCCCHFA